MKIREASPKQMRLTLYEGRAYQQQSLISIFLATQPNPGLYHQAFEKLEFSLLRSNLSLWNYFLLVVMIYFNFYQLLQIYFNFYQLLQIYFNFYQQFRISIKILVKLSEYNIKRDIYTKMFDNTSYSKNHHLDVYRIFPLS